MLLDQKPTKGEDLMLTPRQRQVLVFIHDSIGQTGVAPSFSELARNLGVASKSGIHRIITELESKGFVRRLPRKAHALEILRMPGDTFDNPDLLGALDALVSSYDSGKYPPAQAWAMARSAVDQARQRQKEMVEE